MVHFVMMIGLPASGKTSYAHRYHSDYIIRSSDELRQQMFGDVQDQTHNDELFSTLHPLVKIDLKNGRNVVYDATNINWKRRRTFLNELKNIECFKECVFCVSPVHMCKKRNSTRERQVPDDVIDKMLFNFNIPYYYEGWDKITVHYDYIRPYIDIDEIFNPICGVDYFKQHNPNHTLTLGAHMRKTRDIVEDILYNTYDGFYSSHGTIDILDAATIHDIGKVQTQVFHNFRGDKTDIAHYYNHQYVGAYNSMFVKPSFDYADYSILKRAVMIMWHMQPFFFSGEKNELKWKNLWGEELYNNIMTIHKADTEAK